MALLISINARAEIQDCRVFNTMNQYQFNILSKSYQLGKPHDLGWSLAAQSWAESSAGKNIYRPEVHSGGSHGVYQSLLDNVLFREYGMRLSKDEHPEAEIAPTWLVFKTLFMIHTNQKFAAKHAILELKFWKKHTKSYWAMWASYNGGWNGAKVLDSGKPANPRAYQYAGKIQRYIKLLQTCKKSPLYGKV